MLKKLLLSLSFIVAVTAAFAQELSKEELKAMKRQKKALMQMIGDAEKAIPTDPAGALNTLKPAFDSDYKHLVINEPYLWYVSAMSKLGVLNQENVKKSEGQSYDSNKLYTYALDVYNELAKCDSLDNLPDAKGKVKPQYTAQITKTMYEIRPHLFNGGADFYNDEQFRASGEMFSAFVKSAEHPRLAEFNLVAQDIYNTASFYACMCGIRLEDYKIVMDHIDVAVLDSANAETAYQFKCEAQSALGDTVGWITTLKECSAKYPDNAYFYQSLIQYYDSNNKRDELSSFVDEMIAKDADNAMFVYIKGYIAQQDSLYDDAIGHYNKALEIDPSYQSALTNLALCYLNKAQEYQTTQATTNIKDKAKMKKDKEILDGYYRQALPLYERLRSLVPDKKEVWVFGLYNCYYQLNMEDKLAEIEPLLPKDE